MKIGSLFSGYGGLDMAVEAITGATPAWFCEWDEAPSKILNHHWPHVPNLRDVTQVDWSQVEPVDIITGGSPCQDLSQAGKRAGMTEGTRSNLWVNMREAIHHLKPQLVVWENVLGALSATATSDSDMEPSAGLLGNPTAGHLRALGRVLGDLAEIGYDTKWTTVRASDVGAPHHRARVFLIAWPCDSVLHPGHRAGCRELRELDEKQAPWFGEPSKGPADAAGERVQVGGRLTRDSEQGDPSLVLGGDVLPADPERNDGGPWSSGGDRWEAPIGTFTTGGPEHSCSAGDENFTDTNVNGPQAGHECTVGHGEAVAVSDCREQTLPDPSGERRDGRGATPLEAEGPHPATDRHSSGIEWGEYAPAIRRWERVVGPSPAPTEPNSKGNPRLNAAFAEWMMGLPAGHVTAPEVGLTRAQQLKAIGNGVCPQQAEAALLELLQR